MIDNNGNRAFFVALAALFTRGSSQCWWYSIRNHGRPTVVVTVGAVDGGIITTVSASLDRVQRLLKETQGSNRLAIIFQGRLEEIFSNLSLQLECLRASESL